MKSTMRDGMAEALRLTRAGRLASATAAIQRSLGGLPGRNIPQDDSGEPSQPIEGTFRVIGDEVAPAGP